MVVCKREFVLVAWPDGLGSQYPDINSQPTARCVCVGGGFIVAIRSNHI